MLTTAQSPQTLSVSVGQYSSAGQKPENQDFYGAVLPSGSILALKGVAISQADGISSSQLGGQAAQTAVGAFLEDYYATPDSWSVKTAATRVIEATNGWLFAHNDRSIIQDKNTGLVCTFDALILKGREAHVFHVGDSRIWRLNGHGFERLTHDHELKVSAETTYLSRALGIHRNIEIDYTQTAVEVGDIFLLTTDGVHGALSTPEISKTITATNDLENAARMLVEHALHAGSLDNATAQLLRVEALPPFNSADALGVANALPPLKQLSAGDHIDGWRVVRSIHASSRSHVFQVVSPSGVRAALKYPASEMQQDQEHLQRFLLEEWIARRIDSDHVLPPLRDQTPRTALYILSPFFEGQTLRDWMAAHPAPALDAIRDILSQLVAGLRAFHRKEMLHQDIRPENILIDNEGTLKIIDFGSVRVPGLKQVAPGIAEPLPGTFQYTAPEYMSGDAISWRSDQYSLGVIAYEMLTGRLPYGTAAAKVTNRQDQRRLVYTPIREYAPEAPIWLDSVIRRAVHPDPLRRFDALSEFIMQLNSPPSPATTNAHVPLADRNPARFWKSVSALLAALIMALLIDRTNG